ncbi:MAG: carbamoyl phosphate synthase small subunit [[Lactobacillus] timonensis]|jgi:carbamoyl-phosphate synthase small subunit|uniref:carbamoyl phosphate synthase small subunit n=2 Tax=[Lactobacillus] timonensis TaxID=1970790 RepID=UPI000C855BEB|nr:carbamoyl phosphate synthase small subunit [[Lactobacillus] timonensis]MCI1926523.1 carbamoyl phosphate synthase small subunit [[Lactobacillus] timonensis]MCI1957922.1 carbamoyl phosphate synthase small subunit [[Lactobacillus] timonensis]MCI1970907.1 carbamoyl phosphate synthase small subunit [[Lactobacillus] timonensis]
MSKRYLILEDGTVFEGKSFGANRSTTGEVVFTTGMTGYQEAITDQSYANQILVFTNPLIGNYGVTLDDYESLQPHIKGVICREVANHPCNWRMQDTLPHFLEQNDIPGLKGIDTRELVRQLRVHGTLRGQLTDKAEDVEAIVAELKKVNPTANIIQEVSTKTPFPNPGTKRNIVVIDFGLKNSILRELAKRDCNVIVLPYDTPASQVLNLKPDGVLLSNGPGDPKEMSVAFPMVREVEKHLPLFGICMGHQVFALANGADTYQMKFGHRGFNHPVRELATGIIAFTSQNHGYAVDPQSVEKTPLMVTRVEINDNTVEGLQHRQYPAFSVQFHPDAAPGPHDAVSIFDDFMSMVDQRRKEAHDAEEN